MPAPNLEEQYHTQLARLQSLRTNVLRNPDVLKAYNGLIEIIEAMKAQKASLQILILGINPAIELLEHRISTKTYDTLASDMSRVNFVHKGIPSIWAISLYYLSWAVFILSFVSMVCLGPIGFAVGAVGIIGSFFITDVSLRNARTIDEVNLGDTMKALSAAGNSLFLSIDPTPSVGSEDLAPDPLAEEKQTNS